MKRHNKESQLEFNSMSNDLMTFEVPRSRNCFWVTVGKTGWSWQMPKSVLLFSIVWQKKSSAEFVTSLLLTCLHERLLGSTVAAEAWKQNPTLNSDPSHSLNSGGGSSSTTWEEKEKNTWLGFRPRDSVAQRRRRRRRRRSQRPNDAVHRPKRRESSRTHN